MSSQTINRDTPDTDVVVPLRVRWIRDDATVIISWLGFPGVSDGVSETGRTHFDVWTEFPGRLGGSPVFPRTPFTDLRLFSEIRPDLGVVCSLLC